MKDETDFIACNHGELPMEVEEQMSYLENGMTGSERGSEDSWNDAPPTGKALQKHGSKPSLPSHHRQGKLAKKWKHARTAILWSLRVNKHANSSGTLFSNCEPWSNRTLKA